MFLTFVECCLKIQKEIIPLHIWFQNFFLCYKLLFKTDFRNSIPIRYRCSAVSFQVLTYVLYFSYWKFEISKWIYFLILEIGNIKIGFKEQFIAQKKILKIKYAKERFLFDFLDNIRQKLETQLMTIFMNKSLVKRQTCK